MENQEKNQKGNQEYNQEHSQNNGLELLKKVIETNERNTERFRKTKKKVVGNNVNNKKINNSGKKGFKIEEIEDKDDY